MSLKSKIEKIIAAIKNSNISEIEISNFWGAQKIKLKTSNSNDYSVEDNIKVKEPHKNNPGKDASLDEDNINVDSNGIIDSNHDKKDDGKKLDNTNNIKEYTIINAPLVGTFYQSSKPGEKPFVEVGNSLNIGDPLCIIEAMKIFNTIESEYAGEIKEIFVQDGEPVEYGQALFSIDSN